MGRPIGSVNRQKPFNDALLMTLRSNPLALRRIAAKLVERAEEGDLAAIREIADRLDGKAPQAVEVGDVPFDRLTDAQLNAIAAAALPDTVMMPKALPPPRKFSQG